MKYKEILQQREQKEKVIGKHEKLEDKGYLGDSVG